MRPASDSSAPFAPEVLHPDQLPSYVLPDTGLEMGASLGNSKCWVNTKGNGTIEYLFSTELGKIMIGPMTLCYSSIGSELARGRAEPHEARACPPCELLSAERTDAFVQLQPENPGTFEVHPAYQRHRFTLPHALEVVETTFVPKGGDEQAILYRQLEITNRSPLSRSLRIYGFAHLRGETEPDLEIVFHPEQQALMASNRCHPNDARVFGVTTPVAAFETTFDSSLVYNTQMRPLSNRTTCQGGHMLGALQVDLAVPPGETCRLAFLATFSPHGPAEALQILDRGRDAEAALQATIDCYQQQLASAQLLTPDPTLNQGALWAKVNMLRVMADYPEGPAFTNDPSRSSAVVARDACWFVYGCDHFLPAFSSRLLEALAQRQNPSGKIIEFYDAVTGATEDYGLNINDNTPLFILAVNHHWRSTGCREELERLYPAVRRAAQYILSQEDERGLVFCTATGQDLHGIIGWRNIIPNYRISGAVTEVNAECAAALRAAGHLAENLGRPHQEAQEFMQAAKRLTEAINTHLLNPETGVYYLTLDVDGSQRSEITADEVFPVIFRVAPDEVAFHIISRLNYPDFWTEAGLRTTSQQSLDYNAYQQWGLLGGVWPGMTWWFAFAAARYHPDVMVKALHASFAHYARDPKKHNTVPGQFSEWFDGESLVNRGMRLSPWEAPRFLWAAVEGVCGLMLRPGEQHPQMHPLLPEEWRWVGLRRLPYHGHLLSCFVAREQQRFRLYSDQPINTRHHLEVFQEEVSDQVLVLNGHLEHLALRRPGEVTLCIGNTSRETVVSPVYLLAQLLHPEQPYQLTIYNSERQAWVTGRSGPGQALSSLAVTIEVQGFRILRWRQAG
jgi:hypothetical protein